MSPRDPSRDTVESLQAENQRLKRAVEELSILNELAKEIGASLDLQQTLERIVNRARRAVHAEQGVIFLVRPDAGTAETVVRVTSSPNEHLRFRLQDSLLGWMYLHKEPLLVNDSRSDPRFRGEAWDENVRSLLSAPLMVKASLVGVLAVYNKKENQSFSTDDKRLLAILASQSAQILENVRLYEEEKQLVQMRQELELAADIQRRLLPAAPPSIAGYDIAGTSVPARMVGGDFFDFIQLDQRRLVLCLGDVSGKGLPAALLAANLQATIRGQTLMDASVKECVERLNRHLHGATDPEKFATLFYGIVDLDKEVFRFSNAGHQYPFLLSRGKEPLRLRSGGPLLGFLTDSAFREDEVPFGPGDLLVVFSDGITDAFDENDEEFGEHRLWRAIAEGLNQSAHDLIDTIVGAVRRHSRRVAQTDDITLVVMKRSHASGHRARS